MAIQGAINKLIGTAGAAATLADKLSKEKSAALKGSDPKADVKAGGIDLKMAAKARKTFQQKANAIYMNKEISNKAKTRRLGAALDEYNKTMGGKK